MRTTSFYLKNSLFLLITIGLIPFSAIGFCCGLVACALRGGYRTAEELVTWVLS